MKQQKPLILAIIIVSIIILVLYFSYTPPSVERVEPEIKNRDGIVNFDEALIYRQVIREGDTLRTILIQDGCVMYVPRWWTVQEIDSVIITLFGKQNWYGSE